MAGAWLVPALPLPGRIGVSVTTIVVGALASLVVHRRIATATTIAHRVAARAQELRRLATTDPAARVEHAAYLAATADMLRRTPRPRGLSRAEHAALVAHATQRLDTERTALLQQPGASLVSGP